MVFLRLLLHWQFDISLMLKNEAAASQMFPDGTDGVWKSDRTFIELIIQF